MKISVREKEGKDNQAVVALVSGSDDVVLVTQPKEKTISLGIGDRKDMTRRKLIVLARRVITYAKSHKIKKLTLSFSSFQFPQLGLADTELAELLAISFEMANFEFVTYKTPPKEGWSFVEEISIIGRNVADITKGIHVGQMIGQEVNRCRTLANTPAGDMTPKKLALRAREAVKGLGVGIRVLGRREMVSKKMGAILGVAQGSAQVPQFIILEYKKGGKEKPVVLVGKGVTFDSGGLNIKPEDYMRDMHMDMSGGAAVIHTIALAARLKLKKNIVGLVPAVENMPSGTSYRPGDVLRSMSGKTIEILDTDAEGRVILADGLSYAAQYKPRLVVDVATLTGAAASALGERASAIFSKDSKIIRTFEELGEETGEYVWPLPLWEEYEEEIKGTFGDWANIGKKRYGGAITAAIFLYQFAKDYPWVHMDIAPRMTSVDGEHLAKGAAGAPIRLLIKLLERF